MLLRNVVFVVGHTEVRGDRHLLAAKSAYFKEIFSAAQRGTEIRLVLPDWVDQLTLGRFLNYLAEGEVPATELLETQKLL